MASHQQPLPRRSVLWLVLLSNLLHQHGGVTVSAFRSPVVPSFTRSEPFTSTRQHQHQKIFPPTPVLLLATVASSDEKETKSSSSSSSSSALAESVLKTINSLRQEAVDYADDFDLSEAEAALYALFAAIRKTAKLGLHGEPFVLRHDQIKAAMDQDSNWQSFFTMKDLEQALQDDFLDASRGSTDNRKGWKITDVSQPRGDSFEEARMTFQDVQTALEKGTVIFNAAGAHIPKLAGPSLACSDATSLPCALNLYVTASGKRTSAPPHTDKQDVLVVQSTGCKYWRVYSPPDPALKPAADMFARGKNDDSLPLHQMEHSGSRLLLETTLNPGDALFVPAAFPHTTGTVVDDNDETSIHLTLGIDHHIWELDYLSARRLALRRACVKDTALGQMGDEENRYIGKANELPDSIRKDLFAELPLGFLDLVDDDRAAEIVNEVASELERLSRAIDKETAAAVDGSVWKETVERLRQQGMELFETHRDMHLAAIAEGKEREAEEVMTAHLDKSIRRSMTPERIQRLSLFRVKRFYDDINKSKKDLLDWSYAGKPSSSSGKDAAPSLPSDWALTLPVKVGDQVEADLGGAFFPATVSRASDGTYDVQFFDGDRETGLDRSQIKLITPPPASPDEVDTSNMTPKQLMRWKKQRQKLKREM